MRVGVQRDSDVLVPHPLLDHLRICASLNEQGRAGVAEIMNADWFYPRAFAGRHEHVGTELCAPASRLLWAKPNCEVTRACWLVVVERNDVTELCASSGGDTIWHADMRNDSVVAPAGLHVIEEARDA